MTEQIIVRKFDPHFPNGLAPDGLRIEINASAAVPIHCVTVEEKQNSETLERFAHITFQAELTDEQEAALDSVVIPAHDHTHTWKVGPQLTDDGIPLVQQNVQTVGWQICDRNILLRTSTLDAGHAVEDWRVDLSTMREVPWDECTLVGCFKDTDPAAILPLEPCGAGEESQAILSVFNYCALNQNTAPKAQVPYDMKDGGLIVDLDIPPSERYQHRAYAIGAPGLAGLGQHVRFFGGYLAAQPDGRIQALSPQAKRMPADIDPAAGCIRIFLFHPAGAVRSHVLRLVTYRALGTV